MGDSKKTFADLRQQARESASTRWSRKELVQIGLFKGAHQESIVPLLRDCPVRVLANGEVLLHAGERCEVVFIVLSGKLRREGGSSMNPNALIGAGGSIGELILREKVVFDSAISAVEPTRLLVIDRQTGWGLIRKSLEISNNWMSLFIERRRGSGTSASAASNISAAPKATHIGKTGLYNRSWLESMLPREIARSRAAREPLGLMLIEIDRFADYIARFGSATRERAYQAVAQAIVANIRPTDAAVCYSATQLAVVLLASSASNACIVAERVRNAVSRSAAFPHDQNVLHSLTLSIGVTESHPSADTPALLAAAEAALQLARASGGDRVAMH